MFRRIKILIVVILVILSADVARYTFYPDVALLKNHTPAQSAFMAQREAEAAAKGQPYRAKRKWISLRRVSPCLVRAVLIAEDDKFWHHQGFDLTAIRKAFERNIEAGSFKYGASTITQQLARNLYLTPSKNPLRKAKEAILTIRLEYNLSKKRILELYLNFAEWGRGIFGIEAASLHYFKKSASDLTPWEAAKLASVLPNPRRFSPVGRSAFVTHRARHIYKTMKARGI